MEETERQTMKTWKGLCAAFSLALISALCGSAAVAEMGNASANAAQSSALPGEVWSYSTYYIYPLTRHIDESGVSGSWRYALYPFTVALDTAQLPFGALAGLFGD